jgi:hypothetical protein
MGQSLVVSSRRPKVESRNEFQLFAFVSLLFNRFQLLKVLVAQIGELE